MVKGTPPYMLLCDKTEKSYHRKKQQFPFSRQDAKGY